MQDSIWDAERLSNIGWLMSRYSEHIQPSDRIKLGIEGDPCGVFRGVDDAPSATIKHVSREDNGFVRFTAVIDDSGVEVELDNRNVAPEKVWEIHPDFVETFRGRVNGEDLEEEHPHDEENLHDVEESRLHEDDRHEEPVATDDEFRSSVQNHVESLDERLKRMESAESELERTIASAVRELAGDLMRAYRGEEPEFAFRYADRYDLALTRSGTKDDAATEEETPQSPKSFRGSSSSKKSPSYRRSHQNEKDTFDLESLSFDVKESSVLSD